MISQTTTTTITTPVPYPVNHCSHGALTGPLGLLVQSLLAFVAFSALIVKRYCEPIKTRRGWTTWWFDTSKQVIGAAVIHIANILLSEHLFTGDPCTWYVISFMLDSTIGIIIICICLKISLMLILRRRWNHLVFGIYSTSFPCRSWFYQCVIYVNIIIFEKVTVTFLTLLDFWRKVGEWVFSRTTNADLELVIVMFIIPLVVNAVIFWIVDNFLKLHHPRSHQGKKYHPFVTSHDDDTSRNQIGDVVVLDGETDHAPTNRKSYQIDYKTNSNHHHRQPSPGNVRHKIDEVLPLTRSCDYKFDESSDGENVEVEFVSSRPTSGDLNE